MSVYKSKLNVRLIVVGDVGTGKSSLIRTYLGKDQNIDVIPKTDTSYSHQVCLQHEKIDLQILDSDGKNSAVNAWSHGVVIVFSLDNHQSFEHAKNEIKRAKELTVKSSEILLLGNNKGGERQVTSEETLEISTAEECKYVEVCAKSDVEKIRGMFDELAIEIIKKRGCFQQHHKKPVLLRKFVSTITGKR